MVCASNYGRRLVALIKCTVRAVRGRSIAWPVNDIYLNKCTLDRVQSVCSLPRAPVRFSRASDSCRSGGVARLGIIGFLWRGLGASQTFYVCIR